MRHGEDLRVVARLVAHQQHADRIARDQAAREGRSGDEHEHVERIAVAAERVEQEAVVAGVDERRAQRAVEHHAAEALVVLVLVAAALRDLDERDGLGGWCVLHLTRTVEGRAADARARIPRTGETRTAADSYSERRWESLSIWRGCSSSHAGSTRRSRPMPSTRRASRASRWRSRTRGLDGPDVALATIGGLLHDVGKIAVPMPILAKRGRSTSSEYDQVKRHPVASGRSDGEWVSGGLLRHHHERWDGRGYPDDVARLVAHQQHADRIAGDQAAGEGRSGDEHEHVEGVAVTAERVEQEPVVAGVDERRAQRAIEHHAAEPLVVLVLVAAPLRDLDERHGLFGWGVLHLRRTVACRAGDAPGSHPPDGGDWIGRASYSERSVGESLDLARLLELARWLDPQISADAEHSTRVSRVALALADAAGLDGPDVARATLGGLLHDVGKVAVPLPILAKRGPLDELEFDQVKRHPAASGALVIRADMGHLAGLLRHHHERWDGLGYPDGLAGTADPARLARARDRRRLRRDAGRSPLPPRARRARGTPRARERRGLAVRPGAGRDLPRDPLGAAPPRGL